MNFGVTCMQSCFEFVILPATVKENRMICKLRGDELKCKIQLSVLPLLPKSSLSQLYEMSSKFAQAVIGQVGQASFSNLY